MINLQALEEATGFDIVTAFESGPHIILTISKGNQLKTVTLKKEGIKNMKINKSNPAPAMAINTSNATPSKSPLDMLKALRQPAPAPAAIPATPAPAVKGNLFNKMKPAPAVNAPAPAAIPAPAVNEMIARIDKITGRIYDGLNMTIEKFSAIEAMRQELQEARQAAINSEKMIIAIAGAFEKTAAEQNALAIDGAKIGRDILAKLHAMAMPRHATPAPAAIPAPVIINKGKATPAPMIKTPAVIEATPAPGIASDSQALYAAFMGQFKGNFCGSNALDKLADFEALIEALPEVTAPAELDKAIRQTWTNRRQSGAGQFWAAKSMQPAITALIEILAGAGIIPAQPHSNPAPIPGINAPATPAPAVNNTKPGPVISPDYFGAIFQWNHAETMQYINEIREAKNELPSIRNVLAQYAIDNGIEAIDQESINALIKFALR